MRTSFASILLILLPAQSFGEEPPKLRHNPFAVPAEFASSSRSSARPLTLAPENLALHAIIPGPPERALVSLNGKVMLIGDSYSGYTLVAVGTERARFRMEDGSEFELQLRAVERATGEDGPIAVPPLETAPPATENNPESETNPDEQAS